MKIKGALDDGHKIQRREKLILSLSICFVLLTLLILYKVPYNGDDMINCTTPGVLKYEGISIWQLTFRLLKNWIDVGRLYPLAFYVYSLFNVFSTLFAYRTFLIILNLLVISSFGILIYKISKSAQTTSLAILLMTVIIQFRVYHDPVIAFHGMLQFVALYLIWAIFLQIYAIEKKKVLPLIFSSCLYAFCILTYEISYSFIVIFIVTAIIYGRGKMRFLAALPHYLVTAIILLITFYLRFHAPNAYAGTNFSIDISKILKTYINQVSAGFPLSYWILSKPPYLFYSFKAIIENITIWDIFLTGTLFAILLGCFWLLPRKGHTRCLFIYGLMLSLLPPTIISLSERYQQELSIGMGYLPVYVQYFGVALLIVGIIQFILLHIKQKMYFRIITIIFSICICIVFLINNVNNRSIQKAFAEDFSQAVSDTAMSRGLLDSVPDDSLFLTLRGGRGVEFDPQSFVCLYADGLHITAATLQSLVDTEQVELSDTTATIYPDNLYVYEAIGDLVRGIAAAGKVNSIVYDPITMTIVHVYVSEITMYLCDDGSGTITVEQMNGEGAVIVAALQITDIYAEPDADQHAVLHPALVDNTSNIIAERVTPVQMIGQFEQLFAQNQEKSCKLTMEAENGLILFDTISIVGAV